MKKVICCHRPQKEFVCLFIPTFETLYCETFETLYVYSFQTFETNLKDDLSNKEKVFKFVCRCCWLIDLFFKLGALQKTIETQNWRNSSIPEPEIKID